MQVDVPFTIAAEEDQPFKIGKTLIANYKPGLTYRVTMKNKEFVEQLIEDKKAVVGQVRAAEGAPGVGFAIGKVSVAPKKS